MSTGSDNLTVGNFLKFPAYTTWLATLNKLNQNGKLSISTSNICTAIIPYIRRLSNFFVSTVCSSTSSER